MNKIKKLRQSTGLSQKEFADKYNISVRTLQQWEQGISEPIDAFVELLQKDINKYNGLAKLYKPKDKWNIVIDKPFKNCDKIYPIQQKKVKELLIELSKDKNVKSIKIFGSSITKACHIGSDVDIYVETNSSNTKLDKLYDFEYDLWTNNTVDERLLKEINKKGVVVYERD